MTLTTLKKSPFSMFRLISLVFCLVLMGLAYSSTLSELNVKWTSWHSGYSYSYVLIVTCAAYLLRLVWLNPSVYQRVYWLVWTVFPASVLAWLLGYAVQVSAVQQVSLWLFIAACTFSFLPTSKWSEATRLIIVLSFALPVWDVLTPLLRDLTTFVSTRVVSLFDIPIYIDGYSFEMPGGKVVIASGCAGLNFFLAGIALAGINSLINHHGWRSFIKSVLLMASLSIVGNWVRVICLIFIAHLSEMQHPLVMEHGYFGWIIFTVVFLIYLWRSARWAEPAANNVQASNGVGEAFKVTIVPFICVIWLLPMVLVPRLYQQPNNLGLSLPAPVASLPEEVAERQYLPLFSGEDRRFYWRESVAGFEWTNGVWLYLEQRQGKELISSANQLATEQVSVSVDVALPNVGPLLAQKVTVGSRARLVIATYLVGSQVTSDVVSAKWLQLEEFVKGRTRMALWYATIPCITVNCSQELEAIRQNFDDVERWISKAQRYTE